MNDQQTRKKLIVRVSLIMGSLVFVYILCNLRLVKVSVDRPAVFSISHSDVPAYNEVSPTKTSSRLVWGRDIYIAVSSDSSESSEYVGNTPLLNPYISRDFTLKPQASSSKISSTGQDCVLYDNTASNTSIISSCNSNISSKVFRIQNGVSPVALLDNLSIIQTAPYPGGFIYVSESRDTNPKTYEIARYTNSGQSVKALLSAQKNKPLLINDTSTGYASKYMVNNKLYDLTKNSFISNLKDRGSVGSAYGGTLASSRLGEVTIFRGISPYTESDAEISKADQGQYLDIVSISKANQIKIPESLRVYSLLQSSDGVILIAKDADSGKVSMYLAKNGKIKKHRSWGVVKLPQSITIINDSLYLTLNSGVWSYTPKTGISNLVYSADYQDVKNITAFGNKLYIATDSTKAGFIDQVFNYVIDPSKSAPDGLRTESVLPLLNWDSNLLYADVYRNNIIINYQNNDASLPSAETSLQKMGIKELSKYNLKANNSSYFDTSSNNSSDGFDYQNFVPSDDYTGDGVPPEQQ